VPTKLIEKEETKEDAPEVLRTVFKYKVEHGVNIFELPLGSVVRHFDQQLTNVSPTFDEANMYIWVEQDRVANGTQMRHFKFIGTGHNIPTGGEYVATSMQGPFVWHLYEIL
jgi:hypothetical protein